ncbi:MAG: response regulator transcription factor [Archangiaceae bacterium]|nr:response regulator transcription factor [Archangiaceae bacterium]
MPPASVLIIEDDANLRLTLEDNLSEQGYAVRVASTVAEAWKALEAQPSDVVILDLMLPDGDGYAFCKALRKKNLPSRVLMLTARSLEEDLVRGFDAGADDYLAKPYRLRELYARIAALLRRAPAETKTSTTHRFGPFSLEVHTRNVTGPQGPVELTRKEFDLLLMLLESNGRVLSRDEILDRVWGDVVVDLHTVDNFVSSLKKKLSVKKGEPGFELKTVRGVGFRWVC